MEEERLRSVGDFSCTSA